MSTEISFQSFTGPDIYIVQSTKYSFTNLTIYYIYSYLPYIALPDIALPYMALPNIALPNIALPDIVVDQAINTGSRLHNSTVTAPLSLYDCMHC